MSDSWHEKLRNKNREEIILAGKELFLKSNFLNVNIKDVCNLAGISRVTFYKHFKSIDELIFEVQIDILNNMTKFVSDRDIPNATGRERLETMLYAWIEFGKLNKNYIKFIILFDLYYESFEENQELKTQYENFVSTSKNKNFFNSAISVGTKDGSLKSDLDTVKTGYYIFQTIMGLLQRMSYTMLPVEEDEVITFDDITKSIVDMIIKSIKSEED